jgi:hypothetical protein
VRRAGSAEFIGRRHVPGLVIAAAGFPIEGNRVKIFSGNPEEDSLVERRAEPPSV